MKKNGDKKTELVQVDRAPIQTGDRGLNLTSFDDMWRFASMLAKTNLCPNDFVGKPESCLIAIQYGNELGLSPMASVKTIAVINGRAAIWGDGLLAICQGSPVFDHAVFSEKQVGSGDSRSWVCRVGRIGGRPVERQFSVMDAKLAGLWGKNVWKSYPDRMLQMRARGFALRDCFSDLMCGIIAAEEAMDYPANGNSQAGSVSAVCDAMTLPVATDQTPQLDVLPETQAPAKEETSKSDGETIGKLSNLYAKIKKAFDSVPALDRDRMRERLKFNTITEVADWTEKDAQSALDVLREYEPVGAGK